MDFAIKISLDSDDNWLESLGFCGEVSVEVLFDTSSLGVTMKEVLWTASAWTAILKTDVRQERSEFCLYFLTNLVV